MRTFTSLLDPEKKSFFHCFFFYFSRYYKNVCFVNFLWFERYLVDFFSLSLPLTLCSTACERNAEGVRYSANECWMQSVAFSCIWREIKKMENLVGWRKFAPAERTLLEKCSGACIICMRRKVNSLIKLLVFGVNQQTTAPSEYTN